MKMAKAQQVQLCGWAVTTLPPVRLFIYLFNMQIVHKVHTEKIILTITLKVKKPTIV